MGGGDLNTKKSWHPSTLKNQERVWKAEQAVAEEKKKILELQRERDQEHDRAQLNSMVQQNFGTSSAGGAHREDNRLHWMYDKPDKQAQHEDYLLGKEIGKSEESERTQNAIPAVSRRVVGSSMMSSGDDTQVDLTRKLREDPLLLVKERERAARAALLNNPLQRKKLAELLRKEQDQKKSKSEGKSKKKSKKKSKSLDAMLAAKLNALGDKGMDLNTLLNSDDSSSDSSESDSEKLKKKKKKKDKVKKKKKKSKKSSDSESTEDEKHSRKPEVDLKSKSKQSFHRGLESSKYDDKLPIESYHHQNDYRNKDDRKHYERYYDSGKHQSSSRHDEPRKRRNDSSSDSETKHKKNRRENPDKYRHEPNRRGSPERRERRENTSSRKDVREKKQGLSESERAAKLAEMAAAGRERETERGIRVARQREEDAVAESSRKPSRSLNNEARALPDSLESRIRSNRHYIQRDKTHMNQNFAKR